MRHTSKTRERSPCAAQHVGMGVWAPRKSSNASLMCRLVIEGSPSAARHNLRMRGQRGPHSCGGCSNCQERVPLPS